MNKQARQEDTAPIVDIGFYDPIARSIKIPSLEIPHLFIDPSNYIPGAEGHLPEAKIALNRNFEIRSAIWPAAKPGFEGPELINILVKKPNFVVRAIEKAHKDDWSYRVKDMDR